MHVFIKYVIALGEWAFDGKHKKPCVFIKYAFALGEWAFATYAWKTLFFKICTCTPRVRSTLKMSVCIF